MYSASALLALTPSDLHTWLMLTKSPSEAHTVPIPNSLVIVKACQRRSSCLSMHVGNAPWPIGVTSIGIHDRSAREKIGHTMNAAHIMNDEATRKYLQGLKRLLTFMQRIFPTDPSRAVDFDGFRDVGRGAAGSGSDKLVCNWLY